MRDLKTLETTDLDAVTGGAGKNHYTNVIKEDWAKATKGRDDARSRWAKGDKWGTARGIGRMIGWGAKAGLDAVVPGEAIARAARGD